MQRKRNKIRRITPRILVLCEGLTEKHYFSDLKNTLSRQAQRDISVVISQASETEPKKILKEAQRRQIIAKNEQQPYQDIWLVFDDDNRKGLKQVFDEAKKDNIKIAYSSVCFEIWFLLHFEKKAKTFINADNAKYEVCTYIPGYYENMTGVYHTILQGYKKNALPNAKWLQNQQEFKDMYTAYLHNPITNVNYLTEFILNFGKE